jgi:hypothetical protein
MEDRTMLLRPTKSYVDESNVAIPFPLVGKG